MARFIKIERSCGAVLWRVGENGREYLLVRNRCGAPGFPKGHVEGGETEGETALREIREETGLRVTLDEGFRRVVQYSPKEGVLKDVVFFAAEYAGGEIQVQPEEVAMAKFLPLSEAVEAMTYDTDRDTLRALAAYLEQRGIS